MAKKKLPIPLTVTIPVPSHIPKARGIHSTNKFGDFFKARCNAEEKKLLQDAAAILDVTEAEFIRWCTVFVAKVIVKCSK